MHVEHKLFVHSVYYNLNDLTSSVMPIKFIIYTLTLQYSFQFNVAHETMAILSPTLSYLPWLP